MVPSMALRLNRWGGLIFLRMMVVMVFHDKKFNKLLSNQRQHFLTNSFLKSQTIKLAIRIRMRKNWDWALG
jgi:hypothetical protein